MPSAHASLGLQAVILCGPGTSLYPFTGNEDLPKALVPVANKPMIHYPLEWCEKAGFDSILVLTLTEHHAAIQSYIRARAHRSKMSPVQVEAASSLEDNLGTADVLRVAHQKGWLTSDLAVLPCDLITNLEPARVAELWMVMQAGFDSDLGRRSRMAKHPSDGEDGRRGMLGLWYEAMGEGAIKGQETDFLMVAPTANSSVYGGPGLPRGVVGILLDTFPTQALKEVGELGIRQDMLKKHPDFKLINTCRDSGLYFLPYWVLKFIDRNPRLNSLREDVLPWIAKARWQNRRLAEKLGLPEILTGGPGSDTASDEISTVEYDVASMSSTRISRPLNTDTAEQKVNIPSITTYIPVASPSIFIRRVDTAHLYLYACLHLAKSDPTAPSTIKIDPSVNIGPKAIVTGNDCLVGDKVSIGEKAIVKKSVLGSGVSLGKNVRLTGCVLMDGAAVAEGARLESCIIGRKAVIGSKATLKDCEVAEGYVVEEGAEAKGERFVAGLEADSDDFDEDVGSGGASDADDDGGDDDAAFSDEDDD